MLATSAALLAPAPAQAAIPQGNLVVNGDGEVGTAVSDGTSQYCPQSWTCESGTPTLARYGSQLYFPSAAESARIGGGSNFFLGGPNSLASYLTQPVGLSAAAAEIDAGQAQYTFGGCFGGKADDPDYALMFIGFLRGDGSDNGFSTTLEGPTPAERNNQTKLLPRSGSPGAIPAGTRAAYVYLRMIRANGNYNDASADNLSFRLGPIPGAAPEASPCLVPGAGSGGGSGGGGSGGGGGANSELTSGVLAFSDTAKVRSDGKARIRVRCNTVEVERCKGSLSVSLSKPSQSAAKKKVTLGTASYSIPSAKKRTVTVPLRKADAKTIAELSSKDLAKRRLKVKAKTRMGRTKVKQTVRLKIRYSG